MKTACLMDCDNEHSVQVSGTPTYQLFARTAALLLFTLGAFGQGSNSASQAQNDSTLNPLVQAQAQARQAAEREADGKEGPDRDDPQARMAWQIMAHGVPSVQYKQQLHNLRMERVAAAHAMSSTAVRGASSAAIIPGLPVWIPIGPTGADYEQNGPFTLRAADSGRIRTILPDPAITDHLYLLTSGGGLWSTSNFSAANPTWTPLQDSVTTTGGGSVTFGRSTSVLYLGTGDPFDIINVGGSVTQSIDGGVTWSTPVDLGTAMSVRDIKVDTSVGTTAAQDIVLAATDVGMFRSTDGGATFVQVALGGVLGNSVWSIVKTSAGWLANAQPCGTRVPATSCGTASTNYISADSGATWNPVPNTGLTPFTGGRATLSVGAPGDAVVYAFAENVASTDQGDLFRSANGGLTWTALAINAKIPTNAAGNTDNPNMDLMHNQSFYNQMIVVDPADAARNTVYLGGNLSSARTTNGGASWTLTSNWLAQFGLSYVHADMHAAAIIPTAPATLVFGTDGGISVSTDAAATFTSSKNSGLQTFLVYSIASSPAVPAGVISGMQDVGTRARSGSSTIYNQTIGGDGLGAGWSQANAASSLGTVEFNSMFSNLTAGSPDVGEDWDRISLGIPAAEQLFFTPIGTPSATADPTGKVFFTYSGLHIFKSVDGGVHWTTIGTLGVGGNVPVTLAALRGVPHGVGISPVDTLHIAIAGGSGHLAVTVDGGTTWKDVSIGPQFVTGFANISGVTWADNSTLYVTSENPLTNNVRIAKSIDGGTTWTRADTGLPDVQANRVIVDPRDATNNTLLVVNDLGVFRSTNGGVSWAAFGTGLPNVRVNDIYMPPDGSFVRIATYGRGNWELPSLTFAGATLSDDVTSCDRDGVLDNTESGHLVITLHNDGGSTLSAITATVTSASAGVTFPSGNTVNFPPATANGNTTASVVVALNGPAAIQQLDFQIAFTDPALNLSSPVNAIASLRANYDEIPASTQSDDVEAVNSAWTPAGTAENLPDLLAWHHRQFSTLDHRWVGGDSNLPADTSLVSPALVIGAGPSSFSFSHRYLFEFGGTPVGFFDGGVIEISQDNGATWADVTTLAGASVVPPYDHALDASVGNVNVLAGRQAFSGASASYPNMQTTTVNLPVSLANKTIRIRFRIGTDNLGGASGWTIDNIAFTGLAAASTPFPSVVADRHLCAGTATTTTLTSAPNPSVLGQNVIFTATVTGGATPAGNVIINLGTSTLGTVPLDAAGQATFNTRGLPVGTHSITGNYAGDATHAPSSSAPVSQVVTVITPTTTALTSNLDPSNLGQSVTFTATVTGGITPTGNVTFNDGATPLATVALAAGQATFSTSALSAGSHSITAAYAGDTIHIASTSPAVIQVVNGTPTTTALVSSLNPSIVGQSVTFTATVTGGATPTGNVTFSDGATALGAVALTAGQATFTTSALTTGTHSITASYGGDGTHNPSTSAAVSQAVNPLTVTTSAVASNLNPSTVGQSVTFTATVAGGATPTGNITFNDGATPLATVALAAGQATFSTSALAPSSHPITVVYAGDATHAASTSPAVIQVVNGAPTTTTQVSSVNPTVFGQSVTFTATVAGGTTPTGNVTFNDGATPLSTVALVAGQASFTTTSLTVGTHAITTAYAGDATHNPSTSAAVNQVVNKATTTTAVAFSVNPATFGQTVTLTATINPSAATGTVTFTDGALTLGTGTVTAGVATFSASALAVGTHPIAASYGGDGNFNASASAAQTLTVNQTATTTVLAATTTAAFGSPVTFHATVTPAAATGTVTFKDGATTLGTGAVTAGAASFTTSTLATGPHSITASYGGDANDSASTSATQTQTITAAASTTVVTSSLNPGQVGVAITLTATLASSGGTPTGNVTFNEGATVLGAAPTNASGVSTIIVPTFTAGTHSITATYTGNGNFAGSTSAVFVETISAPDYKLTPDKSTVTVLAGQAANINISAQSVSGFSGTVTFSCGTLPALTTCTFTPASINVGPGLIGVGTSLVVKTTGPHAALINPFPGLRPNRSLYAVVACLVPFGLGFVFMGGAWQRRRRRTLLTLAMFALAIAGLASCGGGSTTTPPAPATPAGTTQFAVSATSTTSAGSPNPANPSQQLNISITVQP